MKSENARRDLRRRKREAVEHAVMADIGLQPMRLAAGRNVDAQAMRGFRLPDSPKISSCSPSTVIRATRLMRAGFDRRSPDGSRGQSGERVAHEDGLDRSADRIPPSDP